MIIIIIIIIIVIVIIYYYYYFIIIIIILIICIYIYSLIYICIYDECKCVTYVHGFSSSPKNPTQGPESSRLMEAWKANKPNGVFNKVNGSVYYWVYSC